MEISLSRSKEIYRNHQKTFDSVAIEEPLEISLTQLSSKINIHKKPISVTMRTPGADKDLALGFLYSEGILNSMDHVKQIRTEENKIDIVLHPESTIDLKKLDRHFYTTSSCGVCGKSSIEAITTRTPKFEYTDLQIHNSLFKQLPSLLKKRQATFQQTGGLHAAGLFSPEGKLISLYEDVGRHNAMDKLIGHHLQKDDLPLDKSILLLSGRTSFELVQKSVMAGIQVITAIGAPSTLAIDLATEKDCTLIGFLSSERFNIYSGQKRVLF